jgi:hypothetical protein
MRMDELITGTGITLKEEIGSVLGRIERQEKDINQEEVFLALAQFGELKHIVRELETRLNIILTEHMRMNGDKLIEFGSMVGERKFSSSRKNWEHATLVEAVVNKAISGSSGMVIDPNTGEVVDLANISKPLIDAVVDSLIKTAAIREWRVTALRSMIPGLNPDDFCEVEKAERVSIRKKQ